MTKIISADDIPLYNYPLPQIEQWLITLGAYQQRDNIHCWLVERASWKAEICLEVEELTVRYINGGEGGNVPHADRDAAGAFLGRWQPVGILAGA